MGWREVSVVARQIVIRSGDDLGLAVAEARAARRLSQQELADEVGIERTYLARLENGLTVQLIDRAVRILRFLGATITVTLPDTAQRTERADGTRS
jgi:transcriptional regulator with XRE-family HTH domain